MGRRCPAAVNGLSYEKTKVRPAGDPRPDLVRVYVNARYFCIIGLCVGYLGTEVLTHEATHAGYAYAKRVGRNVWGRINDFDEEQIAYPTGRIAAELVRFLRRRELVL